MVPMNDCTSLCSAYTLKTILTASLSYRHSNLLMHLYYVKYLVQIGGSCTRISVVYNSSSFQIIYYHCINY
jgi:hypothetical protein